MNINWKRLRILLSLSIAVLIIGTIGFMVLEKLSFVDSLYFTIVTISTVGYGDIHPTCIASKLFGIGLIIIGMGVFLSIVTNTTQVLVQRGRDQLRRQRLNMLTGIFFTEIGNRLLHLFTQYDVNINGIREEVLVDENWAESDFVRLRRHLRHYDYTIDSELMELEILRELLEEKGDVLVRQIENPDLSESESFAELLWTVTHLRDEIMSRSSLSNLSKTDLIHLSNDSKRAYVLLTQQWLIHMQHLKRRYPYLFSLAIRMNPFVKNPSAMIE